LALALILDLAVVGTRKDIAYSLVFIWALAGIAVNQAANSSIVLTAEIAVTIIAVALTTTVAFSRLRRK
jgi:hypothetical protein